MDSSIFLSILAAVAIGFLFSRKFRFHRENKTMNSSSLSLSSPLPSLPRNWKHNVFPSFHGPDVRKTLLSHLLKEFERKGIDSFIDNKIERSKSIGSELIEAIRGSRIAIVLLSKNYASSTWCLNELVEIIKCKEKFDQKAMAIFYEVDPTDIKKQTGDFGKVFKKTCKGKTEDIIGRWKHALVEVATIAGYHSIKWDTEAAMIEVIATDVSNMLNNSTPSSDFNSVVGMESHRLHMESLLRLDSKEVRIIGIWGPPGIGKTTIARTLFNQHSKDFQLSIFIDNIRAMCRKRALSDDYSVKKYLQKKFMSQITNQKDFKIPHLGIVEDRLKDKKVLVVLDDVDQLVQLEAMAKEVRWFGPWSRIIITTQDRKLLRASGINHVYKVDFPSSDEALQIFCTYAFGQKSPKDGFEKLAWRVTERAGSLPLGLQIMGSYFRVMYKEEWEKALPRLWTRLDGQIESILKFSYGALCYEDKKLFLHIACFFNNERVVIVEGCLANSSWDVTQGLHVLAEKSLISMDWEWIEMHNLLVRLGREIVRNQSDSKPGKRQFLVDEGDICEVLTDDKADSSNVIGIDVTISYDNVDIICTSKGAFERLSNLQFLRIDCHDYASDDDDDDDTKLYSPPNLDFISKKLRFLSWKYFPMTCFPSSFHPNYLVKLDMRCSKLEKLWEGIQPLDNLKWMCLTSSKRLKELPDLSTATNLQELNLSWCSRLVELPSIGNAINLQKLDLRGCSRLEQLHSSIGSATNLQELDLSWCSSLVELPSSFGNACINLKYLHLNYCSSLVELPSSIGNAINLQQLILYNCSSLVELPSSMKNLCRLSELKVQGCEKLEVLLTNINLESLQELDLIGCLLLKSDHENSTNINEDVELSGTAIQELGPSIGRKSCLRRLVISGMEKLVSLPQLPDSLTDLCVNNCESLERLDCTFRNPDIILDFSNCFKLNQEARDLIIHTPTNEYAVLPGGEVPECFTYRASGSCLTVKLNQMPLPTSTKFKACIILDDKDTENSYGDACCLKVKLNQMSKQNAFTYCTSKSCSPFMEHLYIFEVEAEEVPSTELVFEFKFLTWYNDNDWKIKECGVFQILEVKIDSESRSETNIETQVRQRKHLENDSA